MSASTKRRRVWRVQVSGKWGGTRTLHVLATSKDRAGKEARPLMRNDESAWSVRDTGQSEAEFKAKGGRLS